MILEATGTVLAVVNLKVIRVVIRDNDGHELACKFWGRDKEQANGIMAGQVVRVTGKVFSREYHGKWYTDFECDRLVVTTSGSLRPPPDGPGKRRDPEVPPVDDSDIPF